MRVLTVVAIWALLVFFNEISVLLTVGDNDNVWMTLNVIDFGGKFCLVAELV